MKTLWKATVAGILLVVVWLAASRAQSPPQPGTDQTAAAPGSSAGGTNQAAPVRPDHIPVSRSGDMGPPGDRYPGPAPRGSRFVPICFFAVPISIVAMSFFFKHRRMKMLHETLRAMLEKGVPMTPELIESLKPRSDGREHAKCYLIAGLITSAAGVGVMINLGRPGWVPLLIGAALLTTWLVERRSPGSNPPPES